MAFQAWLADQRAGRDTLLLAPTNAIVDELNVRARSARLAALAQADPQWRPGRDTVLSDQLAASAGDIIRTRDNARWLRLSATDYVRNGYTYEVLEVGVDGCATGAPYRHRPRNHAARRLCHQRGHTRLRHHHRRRPGTHRRVQLPRRRS